MNKVIFESWGKILCFIKKNGKNVLIIIYKKFMIVFIKCVISVIGIIILFII